jgi:hypothetical protein
MPELLTERVYDGISTSEGGVDTGISPLLVPRNRLAGAYNVTVRGGRPHPRPGINTRALDFDGDATLQTRFEDNRFQGATTYYDEVGEPWIVVAIGGRVFRINPANFFVQDISIATDLNSSLTQCYFVQAEQFLIMQDGQSLAWIYDGVTARRANPLLKEVPTGTVMAYGQGRLWVAKGRYFAAGDIVGGSSGSAIYNYRNAVLKFTENAFIAGGGAFYVPQQSGNITAMLFPARQDTATGEGALKIFTQDAIYSVEVPVERLVWQSLQQPVQTVTVLGGGSMSDSVISVNSDLFYRSRDGIRSLLLAQRHFGELGNTPISREMAYYIGFDSDIWLNWFSGVLFDSRLLVTLWPSSTETSRSTTGTVTTLAPFTAPAVGSQVGVTVRGASGLTDEATYELSALGVNYKVKSITGDFVQLENLTDVAGTVRAAGQTFRVAAVAATYSETINTSSIQHRGLASLNFDTVANVREKLPPAWEGMWTLPANINLLEPLTIKVSGKERCFLITYNTSTDKISLHELSMGDLNDGGTDITWEIETGELGSEDRMSPTREQPQMLTLEGGKIWLQSLVGSISMDVWYTPDDHPCWYTWVSSRVRCQTSCVSTPGGPSVCVPPVPFQPQFRRMVLPAPPITCNAPAGSTSNIGNRFRVRIRIAGQAELLPVRLRMKQEPEDPYGGDACTASESCQTVQCCDVSPP